VQKKNRLAKENQEWEEKVSVEHDESTATRLAF
jgi:hypothetical protein